MFESLKKLNKQEQILIWITFLFFLHCIYDMFSSSIINMLKL
jgi:hypothetical protein